MVSFSRTLVQMSAEPVIIIPNKRFVWQKSKIMEIGSPKWLYHQKGARLALLNEKKRLLRKRDQLKASILNLKSVLRALKQDDSENLSELNERLDTCDMQLVYFVEALQRIEHLCFSSGSSSSVDCRRDHNDSGKYKDFSFKYGEGFCTLFQQDHANEHEFNIFEYRLDPYEVAISKTDDASATKTITTRHRLIFTDDIVQKVWSQYSSKFVLMKSRMVMRHSSTLIHERDRVDCLVNPHWQLLLGIHDDDFKYYRSHCTDSELLSQRAGPVFNRLFSTESMKSFYNVINPVESKDLAQYVPLNTDHRGGENFEIFEIKFIIMVNANAWIGKYGFFDGDDSRDIMRQRDLSFL